MKRSKGGPPAGLTSLLDSRFELDSVGPAADVAPEQPGFVLTVDGVLSPLECRRFIEAMEGVAPASAALVGESLTGPSLADLKPKKNEALLNRDSLAVVDPSFAQQLWRRLRPHLPIVTDPGTSEPLEPVGFVGDGRNGEARPSQFKLYRYTKGQEFGLHVDVSRRGAGRKEATEYTLLIYLNAAGAPVPPFHEQPLEGGATVFMATAKKELCRYEPCAGTALLHAHGRRCLLHAGEQVTRGAKYVLRTDVMYGPAVAGDES